MTCKDCIHREVCYKYRLNYVSALDGGCNDYAERQNDKPHGKWIECTKSGMPLTEYGRMMGEKWYGFKCSRCNYIYKGNALVESPYCQECGAKMDGKEADDEQ